VDDEFGICSIHDLSKGLDKMVVSSESDSEAVSDSDYLDSDPDYVDGNELTTKRRRSKKRRIKKVIKKTAKNVVKLVESGVKVKSALKKKKKVFPCVIENCKSRAFFGSKRKRTHCSKHKTINMKQVTTAICDHKKCTHLSSYFSAKKDGVYCNDHSGPSILNYKKGGVGKTLRELDYIISQKGKRKSPMQDTDGTTHNTTHNSESKTHGVHKIERVDRLNTSADTIHTRPTKRHKATPFNPFKFNVDMDVPFSAGTVPPTPTPTSTYIRKTSKLHKNDAGFCFPLKNTVQPKPKSRPRPAGMSPEVPPSVFDGVGFQSDSTPIIKKE
jgi:hypothetical protein